MPGTPYRDPFNIILWGTLAERPDAGARDQVYFVTEGTNLGRIYRGTGTGWTLLPFVVHALDPDAGAHTGTLPKAKVSGLKIDCKIFVQDTDPAIDPANGVTHGDLWIQRVNDGKSIPRSILWVRYELGEIKRWDSLADLLDGYHASEFMLNSFGNQYASAVGAPHSYKAKTAALADDSAKVGGLTADEVMLLAVELYGD